MKVYCTSHNSGPSWHSDSVYITYIGTSIEKAEEVIGDFIRYEKDKTEFPINFPKIYSGLPKDIEWEMIAYYMADGWWYSIVMFELKDMPMNISSEDIANEVSDQNNNPEIKGWTKIYADIIQSAGFKIVKES